YTEDEKLHIARRHLIPKQIEEHGLMADQASFSDASLRAMIGGYTREAGLRNLEREIAKVCRKVARTVAEGKATPTRVTAAALDHFLGVPKVVPEVTLKVNQVGVATGLAWTATGGDILFLAAITMPGTGKLHM